MCSSSPAAMSSMVTGGAVSGLAATPARTGINTLQLISHTKIKGCCAIIFRPFRDRCDQLAKWPLSSCFNLLGIPGGCVGGRMLLFGMLLGRMFARMLARREREG